MYAIMSKNFQRKLSGSCLSAALALTLGCGGINSSPSGNSGAISVSLNQSSANIVVGATTQFAATVTNATNTAVTWSVDGVAGGNSTAGTISSAGLYTAPSKTGTHAVTATSVADTSATAKATVDVGLIGITPASTMVAPGATEQFSASVQGFSNTSVTWAVNKVVGGNSNVGTITAAGMYTAPSQPGNYTVTAASVADTSATAQATVTVESIIVSPASAIIAPAGTEQFTASLPGLSNASVTWSVDAVSGGNSTAGTITAAGLYTAPSQPGSHTITAASVANNTLSASATIGVITLSVSPTMATMASSTTQQFSANVQGSSTASVTWSVDQIAGGNSTVGTISATGLYTAPSKVASHTIAAASTLNGSIAASATVSVFVFRISYPSAAIAPSAEEQFTATIQGLTNTTVTWSVDGVAGGNSTSGTISAGGLYTAPFAIGLHKISATSGAVPSSTVSVGLTIDNYGPGDVLTYHNDDARDGAFLEETQLTPANVNSTQFGKILSYPVDGQIYGQPLYLEQVKVNGALHDVVYVATQNNSVYAFDAASAQPTTFWQVNLGTPVTKDDVTGVNPVVGILSTPVIDVTTNTMYVVAEIAGANNQPFKLHALDVTTGAEKFGGPVTVTGTFPGTGGESIGGSITLGPDCYQRMGLALDPVTNAIYIPFGSCTHGWVLAYDKTKLTQTAIFNDTPNDNGGGGLWASGGAPAIDDTTGDLYLMSGVDQGDDIAAGNSIASGYNDAFMRLNPTDLSVLDYFIPDDNPFLAANDTDLGSGSNILVPDNSSSTPHETIGGGKDGNAFVVNRDGMGGYNFDPALNNVIQTVLIANNGLNNIFSTPVYWNGSIYYHCSHDVLKAFSWSSSTGLLSTTPTSSGANVYTTHGATASLSANGATNGIIWDIDNSAYNENDPSSSGPLVLHAYDASNVATELYNSSQAAAGRDTAGLALKFTVPTITGGRVYVPTGSELDIYGLFP